MTFPFPFVTMGGTFSAPTAPASHTHVYLATNHVDSGGGSVVEWDATVDDFLSCHSDSVNPSRLTIPAAINGRYGRLTCNYMQSNERRALMYKNGASFPGAGRMDMVAGTGDDYSNIVSGPILLSTGDYFELFSESSGFTLTPSDGTWYQLELLPSSFNGALVNKTTPQAIGAGTSVIMDWDNEVFDVGGWHDNVTNNSRLTVPSGVSLVRVSAGIAGGSVASQLFVDFLKNGAGARGMPMCDVDTSGIESLAMMSAPIAVSPADYFEVRAFHTSATSIPNADYVWFGIEELPAALKYAVVYRTTVQAIPSGSTPTTINWDAEHVDTDGWHDNATNNSRLTVPSGVSRVRLTFGAKGSNVSQQWGAQVIMNGTTFIGMAAMDTDTAGTDNVCGATAIIEVVPGDYFELQCFSGAGQNLTTDPESFFAIEECPNHT